MPSATPDCPSARCTVGSRVMGVVQHDGTVAYLHKPIAVDADFVEIATRGRPPEERFRFADKCAEGGCSQWTGSRCGVSDRIVRHFADDATRSGKIPECGLRPTCRWFRQNGLDACTVCPLVTTTVV